MGISNGCCSFLDNFYMNKDVSENKKIRLHTLKGKTIAVDIMGFIYRGMIRYKKNWIQSIKFLIKKFNDYNIKLIFVFDDNPSNNNKEHVFMKRQERHVKQKLMHQEKMNQESNQIINQNLDNLDNLEKLDNLDEEYAQPKINKSVILECEELCDKLGISRIRIKGKEADEIFKFLVDNNIVDGCYSQDNDLLRRGCKVLFYNLEYKINNLDTICVINYDLLLSDLDITSEQFNDSYDLAGTEYNDNLTYCKFKDTLIYIKKYGSLENVLANLDEINNEKTSRIIKIPERFNYLKTREIFSKQLTKKNIYDIMDLVNKFVK